jgi:peptide/nickel transport system permease protein
MQQLSYVLKRFLQMIPVLLVITIVIFFGMRLIPGDPALLVLGEKATPQAIAAMRTKMGLDRPLLVQYFYFLRQVFTLDFGDSLVLHRSVSSLFADRAVITLTYTVMTALFTVALCLPLGYAAGMHNEKALGQGISASCLVLLSLPEFWVGILLLMLLGQRLGWFPVGGWGDSWPEHIHSMVLPALTGCIGSVALLVRNIQSGIVSVLRRDYVDFAKSKGLPAGTIRSRYVIKNVMISSVTLLAMRIAYMLGGSVVIETVFALPGLGKLLVDGVLGRDYPVVEGTVLLFAVIVLGITLVTDICYSLLDPRVKLQ